jgi:hypothetical protein
MQNISNARLSALKLICDQKGWGAADLSRQIGSGTPPYWSELLKGRKAFGEKVARKIEVALGLAPGHLDAIGFIPDNVPRHSKKAQELASTYDSFPDGPKKAYLYEIFLQLLSSGNK